MKTLRGPAMTMILGLSISAMGCSRPTEPAVSNAQPTPTKKTESKEANQKGDSVVNHAIAVLHPTEGNKCKGIVWFTQTDGKVRIVAQIEGLTAKQKHAIHIHEFGDCSDLSGKSAGGHYNPTGHPHALPPDPKRHAGDLGNLQADADGKAEFEITVDNVSIDGSNSPILGRSVIIHAKPDDGGQPTGNAGPRIACGVIGIAKSPGN